MPVTQEKQRKHKKIRHIEYYDLQGTFDKLYADSKQNKVFSKLIPIVTSKENILLAYRNIKRNSGSNTYGVDKMTIKDIEKIDEEKFIEIIRKKFECYRPKAVRRVEIPKPNGKTRPLGIPAMWDRIVQQCLLQVLEPICEAKFHERSNGFRPNRGAEHAIAQSYVMIQKNNLHFVVDVDIKGFFDNVNHAKLIKQMWQMGIRDKKLLCIVKEMLKAPIKLPSGKVIYPTMGTPQGGLLSPLLSNIVLNELDWWVASQWEKMPAHTVPDYPNNKGVMNRGNAYRAFRRGKLKEMHIVRYADDFKIFCRNKNDANKTFFAVKTWLAERLKLEISEEKSKVVNLKNCYSEFLGFKLKAVEKGNSYVVKSHMCDKAINKSRDRLKTLVIRMSHAKDNSEEAMFVNLYNASVSGLHNYYKIATHINLDCAEISRVMIAVHKNRLRKRITKQGDLYGFRYIKSQYGKSAQIRFVGDKPLIPVGYVQHKNPMWKKRSINKYTPDGREEIHKKLQINTKILHALMRANDGNRSVEYMDNRLSLYSAQHGKCSVSGKMLELKEIHCHHKKPKHLGGTDKYRNLAIVHHIVHKLIHATTKETIQNCLTQLQLTNIQLQKLNNLRKEADLFEIVI
ncbi:group II intron reverse transcriptase/maturase [Bengtsoniella intestinalis]|uniref:group II intron reverse transcriptase/maturase n=1 Tax=Bengtsoniella intestinalis TaxID=3073143 RepID=UPI00391F740F